jgi:NAD(P)-dependent dehydrogenase (short-subunit alcohol dehydrogenase family)
MRRLREKSRDADIASEETRMPDPLAVIAGVGPGMGLALARRFAREGYRIAMIARRADALASFAAAIDGAATAHPADLSDPADAARAMAEIRAAHGPAALAIYNASIWNGTPAMAIAPDAFQRDLSLDVTGALVMAQAVYPDMKAAGKGVMLFTGSRVALAPQHGTASPSLAAGKSALRGLVLAMAGELRRAGIRVGTVTIAGTIAPGGPFDPVRIVEHFVRLAALPAEDRTVEIVYDGKGG